jgi:hypothetical protein
MLAVCAHNRQHVAHRRNHTRLVSVTDKSEWRLLAVASVGAGFGRIGSAFGGVGRWLGGSRLLEAEVSVSSLQIRNATCLHLHNLRDERTALRSVPIGSMCRRRTCLADTAQL